MLAAQPAIPFHTRLGLLHLSLQYGLQDLQTYLLIQLQRFLSQERAQLLEQTDTVLDNSKFFVFVGNVLEILAQLLRDYVICFRIERQDLGEWF